jgi:hypothetical protein
MPVIDHYNSLGKVAKVYMFSPPNHHPHPAMQIDSSPGVEEVHATASQAINKLF